jgi:deazaflavin-dependent oxidoreductase (nitroreductase family)
VAAHYQRPPWFNRHIQDPAFRFLMRLGISVWGSRVLRVRGRTSGEWRSTPVNLLTMGDTQYLVSPRGHTQWVRNIRASGEGELLVGRRTQRFKAVEIADDQKISILREYLRRWSFEVGMFFGGVSADSSDAELRRIAPEHPVFQVQTY